MKLRRLITIFITLLLSADLLAVTKYDSYIQEQTLLHFGDVSLWKWHKARLYVESGLNPQAYNPNDPAYGIAQFTLPTAKKYNIKSPKQLYDPYISIRIMMLYIKDIIKYVFGTMLSPKELHDRNVQMLADAGYNAGPGAAKRAYDLSGKVANWQKNKKYLPEITRKYCERIQNVKEKF